MNTQRVRGALASIDEHQLALKWLTEYGVKLTGKSDVDEADFNITFAFAGSCEGAREAARIIEAYARISLPELVATAIRSCNNTITIDRDSIRQELEAD